MRVESGSYEEVHMEESEEELLFIKLLKFQRMNDELYDELEKVKCNYDMATGNFGKLRWLYMEMGWLIFSLGKPRVTPSGGNLTL